MKRIHGNTPSRAAKGRKKYRNQVELLRKRVYLLAGKDKVLMTMYLENGNSFRQIARLTGVNEGTIGRRVRKISKRLVAGEYIKCLRYKDKFTDFEMAVAKDRFLSGIAMKDIAAKHGIKFYHIYKTINEIRRRLPEETDSGEETAGSVV